MAAQMLAHRAVPVGSDADQVERKERRFTRR
jgi:hypothetical protein